ncbi:MAG: MATE family efflux transporter [Parasphingopyxis sp.]|uniref:MATE family efflux transporter n=1 Tax=Parasphingopyxis sp. TaxID=1920299 RepID=UPI0032EED083
MAPSAPSHARAIWAIAIPAMATNVATALLGIADIWVIGQLGDAAAQGAVELGARLLMGLFVVFNFLKSATTGLTAQAVGQRDEAGRLATLIRAAAIALAIGLAMLAVKPWIVPLGLDFLEAGPQVRPDALLYVDIRFWVMPLWLVNLAMIGWLIGLRRLRTVLVVEVIINLLHIGLNVLLVLVFEYGVAGVAIATVIGEAVKFGLLVAVLFPSARPSALVAAVRHSETWQAAPMLSLFRVNRDLFLRTLLLTIAIMLVTRQGAQQGAVILAANAILFQLFMFSALLLDGFENAAQVLCGERIGERNKAAFDRDTRAILIRGVAVALALCALFAVAGDPIVGSFSTDAAVTAAAQRYDIWLIAIPIAGVVSFVYDGVFVGATWTRAMLGTMVAAFALYIALLWLTAPLGNHGIWLSFTIFLIARAAGQALLVPRLARRSFEAAPV